MREVLASIPGFSIKPRRRSGKKLSTAAQLEQTKEGRVDLETPDSILVNTNLRALLNKYTFASLPPLYQNKLVQLLPSVDRQMSLSTDMKLSTSGLNNEFFARACLEWQERLAEGEFTPENQQKLKTEADKERSRVDPWKLKHFEPIWGDRGFAAPVAAPRPPIKTTIKLRPSTTVSSNKNKPAPLMKRLRTVGAMTRSCTSYLSSTADGAKPKSPIPDLLPIKSLRSAHKRENARTSSPLTRSAAEKPSETVPDISVINISDAVQKTDEQTISSVENDRTNELPDPNRSEGSAAPDRTNESPCPDRTNELPNREQESRPQKRKSPSPLPDEEDAKISKLESESVIENQSVEEEQSQDSISSQDSFEKMEIVEEQDDDDEEESEPETTNEIEAEETSSDLETDVHRTFISEPTDTDAPSTVTFEELQLPQPRIEEKTTQLEHHYLQQPEESQEYQESDRQGYQPAEPMPFEILPNTLILQQDSLVLDKSVCSENCGEVCMDESAEKLEASVEESDLVMAQLSGTNFDEARSMAEEEEDANEDKFIDAENYVLESVGQLSVAEAEKLAVKAEVEVEVQAALFGTTTVTTGTLIRKMLNCYCSRLS